MAATMTTAQLVRSLSREMGGTVTSTDEENQTYSLTLPFGDEGRTQSVTAYRTESGGEEWFIVYSNVGSLGELDPTDLLERNFQHYGFSAIGVLGGEVLVIAQHPLSLVDVSFGKRIIREVAEWADQLEEEFYGEDNA